MEKKMENEMETLGPLREYIGYYNMVLGYILGLYGDNGKENGNYYYQVYGWFPKIRGTYYNGESNGKENGK